MAKPHWHPKILGEGYSIANLFGGVKGLQDYRGWRPSGWADPLCITLLAGLCPPPHPVPIGGRKASAMPLISGRSHDAKDRSEGGVAGFERVAGAEGACPQVPSPYQKRLLLAGPGAAVLLQQAITPFHFSRSGTPRRGSMQSGPSFNGLFTSVLTG